MLRRQREHRGRAPPLRLRAFDHVGIWWPLSGYRQARRPPLHPEKRPLTCPNVELKGLEPSTPCSATAGSPISLRVESAGVVSDLLHSGLGHDRDLPDVTPPPYRALPGCLDLAGSTSRGVSGHFLSTFFRGWHPAPRRVSKTAGQTPSTERRRSAFGAGRSWNPQPDRPTATDVPRTRSPVRGPTRLLSGVRFRPSANPSSRSSLSPAPVVAASATACCRPCSVLPSQARRCHLGRSS